MRRYKFMIVALILGTVCMLCGCRPDRMFEVECDGLPEDESVFMLIERGQDDELTDAEDMALYGTEIWSYDKDGMVTADRLCQNDIPFDVYRSDASAGLYFNTKDYQLSFCEKYRYIKLAFCDTNGRIIKVSDELPLLCEDKYAAVEDLEYDCKTGEYTVTKMIERKYLGIDRLTLTLCFTLLSWVSDIILFVILIVCMKKRVSIKRPTFCVTFGVLSLCNVLSLMFMIVSRAVPYYNVYNKKFNFEFVSGLIIDNALWIICIAMLIMYVRRQREKSLTYNESKNI
ncbi:hypothetical protein [Ruminococcus albus]|uniref:Lipoprotein n=1 Tax=Ruminococcus albus TaxID=1264 RepID=A0A1H7M117_RUMAL|nr:hypothetical protein [Ruminococcus albus]SEL04923.1 hypothetical protein SAMN05216469_11081 [Ruminococcus albus]